MPHFWLRKIVYFALLISMLKERKHWFYQKFIWNWHHQNAWVYDWKHISHFGDSQHYYGYQLCSSSHWIFFFIHMRQTSYRGFSRKMKRS
jgi:hypothetical protein